MAKNDNLTDFLKGLADKFRSVLGTADPLNPQDFEDKIQGVYDKGFSEGGPEGITATAPDVLAGKVFGSGGNARATGTMPNQAGATLTTTTRSLSGGYLIFQPPSAGYMTAATKLRCAQANVASTIGLTAATLLKGQAVLGLTGTGVSTPAQIGVKPFLAYSFDYYQVDKGAISLGTAPCAGTLRLWYLALNEGYGDMSIEYFKSGSTTKSSPDWSQSGCAYIDITAQKGESVSVKFKKYGNNSQGFAYFVYYTAVS